MTAISNRCCYHLIRRCIVICTALALLSPGLFLGSSGQEAMENIQSPAPKRAAPKVFRLGFLRTDLEQELGMAWYETLKAYLEQNDRVMKSLQEAGFSEIAVLPTDGHEDMIQAMNHKEFDVAFCSSYVFAMVEQGTYHVILQLRRDSDIWDTRGGGRVLQKGVVFVNNRSPLFTADLSSEAAMNQAIADYMPHQRMAFVSSYSAPSYVYPLVKLYRQFGGVQPRSFIFCGSSEEVVKYVINGLVDIGACEAGVIDEVVRSIDSNVRPERMVRVIFETDFLPTDPIVLKAEYYPRHPLGLAIKEAIKSFYNQGPPGKPRVENSQDLYYQNLREVIAEFNTLRAVR
jgi:ABC-type phosphate/phosphonate transport system substrate-binding protein